MSGLTWSARDIYVRAKGWPSFRISAPPPRYWSSMWSHWHCQYTIGHIAGHLQFLLTFRWWKCDFVSKLPIPCCLKMGKNMFLFCLFFWLVLSIFNNQKTSKKQWNIRFQSPCFQAYEIRKLSFDTLLPVSHVNTFNLINWIWNH